MGVQSTEASETNLTHRACIWRIDAWTDFAGNRAAKVRCVSLREPPFMRGWLIVKGEVVSRDLGRALVEA